MGTKKPGLIAELVVLFIATPILLITPLPIWLKPIIVLTGLIYCIQISRKLKLFTKNDLLRPHLTENFKPIIPRVIVVMLATLALMFWLDPDHLFIVVRKNPLMWVSISIFYSLFSVYPQEFLYRSYFFKRYESLFTKDYLLILINALVFSLAHIIFFNDLVLILTLLGGILFGLTYRKTQSLMFVSIEHSIYGVWLFTIGMGEMLAFPMPE
ncbi:MAG: CPBP family intramembrane metalloprotease [Cyclobacteriaceae bacterium]